MDELQLQAEADAKVALADYGATDLAQFPIDATRIAEYFGAKVFLDDLDDEQLDGFIMIHSHKAAEITLNRNRALNRRRFTCAHELGHFWQERKRMASEVGFVEEGDNIDEKVTVHRRDGVAAHGRAPKEMYANAFAAALLMPERLVKALHDNFTVEEMARFFRVSDSAMRHRIRNLGLDD